MTAKRCYLKPPPGVVPAKLSGLLIVIEGPDSSGRSTHISLLAQWLEERGHAVAQAGLKRSELVGLELEQAKAGNVLSPRTMSLFYATDFYDQLENRIVPALRAGYVVLADRYVFTLMARDIVRGGDPAWLESLYGMALIPDAVYSFVVSSKTLVQRTLHSHALMDYWESGMDLGISRDWFDSFMAYQRRMRVEFRRLRDQYGFEEINANRSINAIQADLRARVQTVVDARLTSKR
jgi:dTMP kinase